MPRVKWEDGPPRLLRAQCVVLQFVVLQAAHVLSVDPEARADATEYYALYVGDLRATARLLEFDLVSNFLDLLLNLKVRHRLFAAVDADGVTLFLVVVLLGHGHVDEAETLHHGATGSRIIHCCLVLRAL